jgi:putative flippase GtrA|tara:strand:- start:839 stop:961 length:123 start_codon:yes stop_codon:yes gene_type:complete
MHSKAEKNIKLREIYRFTIAGGVGFLVEAGALSLLFHVTG